MSSKPPDQVNIVREYAGTMIRDTSTVHSNLGQQIVVTTEDKIRICLMEHLTRIEKRKGWTTPLGIFLTILVVFPTTTFSDFLGLHADTWQAVFILAGILSLLWLAHSLWAARTASTMETVIGALKRSAIPDNQKAENL